MKTYKYEFSHQSNLIQIGNLIDDGHSVHVHLLRLQPLSDRYWTCPECSTRHDRDVNAAINILQAGVPVP